MLRGIRARSYREGVNLSRLRLIRIGLLVISVSSLFLGLAGAVMPQSKTPEVLVVDVDGMINSVKVRLISRTLEQAGERGATLVVIRLNTPGGLLSSTREIVEHLLAAEVPVAVYVYPQGARAGSAGAFITAAANIAVMSPGTNIGAATPVSLGGNEENETLMNKVTNDAAAFMRSIAQQRGRNADKLEETVLEAASFTAQEAKDFNIIDLIALDLDELLEELNGREVRTASTSVILETEALQQRQVEKSVLEQFLELISDPNIAFLLMTIGGIGILIEFLSPGLIVPGVVGVLSLLLAFLAFGNLPVNWAGVAFIALAVILAALEIMVSGFGVLGVGAIISLVIGGFLLFAQFGVPSPTMPEVSVNRWLLVGVAGTSGLVLLYLLRVVLASRRAVPEVSHVSYIVGSEGVVTRRLNPRGQISIGGETWTAVVEGDTVIDEGEWVRVTHVNGLIVTVTGQNSSPD